MENRRNFLRGVGAAAGMALLAPEVARADVVQFRWFVNPATNFPYNGPAAPSNLPTQPVLNKLYADTYLEFALALDINAPAGAHVSALIIQNGTVNRLSVTIASHGGVVVIYMADIFSQVPKGPTSWPVFVASGKPGTVFLTPVAAYKCREIALPPVDYSLYRERLHDQARMKAAEKINA